jgi:hypothetical protein
MWCVRNLFHYFYSLVNETLVFAYMFLIFLVASNQSSLIFLTNYVKIYWGLKWYGFKTCYISIRTMKLNFKDLKLIIFYKFYKILKVYNFVLELKFKLLRKIKKNYEIKCYLNFIWFKSKFKSKKFSKI